MSLRISGLATGIDTESIIKDLMKTHRASVDKVKQNRQLLEWKREALAQINSKIRSFRNDALFSFNKVSTLSAKSATVSGNTSAVSARVLGSAQEGVLSITVKSKATAASNKSDGTIRLTNNFDPSKPLSDEMAAGNIQSIDLSTNNTFKINGTEIEIEAGDSLNKIISKINKNTNVTAYYDAFKGELSITAKNTGKTNGLTGTEDAISIEGDFLTQSLRLTQGGVHEQKGTNAELIINGIETERTSNTFTVNGVEITIHSESGGTESTVAVKTDVDAIMNSIKGFVDSYNEILATITKQLYAERYRDYMPLTDEQKEEMTEKEIELWEEKAKSGLLRGDSILEKAYRQLREVAYSYVNVDDTTKISLANLGIKTGDYKEQGKLHIDEDKLRAAIEQNPDAVVAVFSAAGNGDNDLSDVGLAQRMYDNLASTLKEISASAGTSIYSETTGFSANATLSKRLAEYDEQINRMNDRLAAIEERYYRQFSAMEAAIQRMNTQSAYLMSQFGYSV